jgi:hypothetical protein
MATPSSPTGSGGSLTRRDAMRRPSESTSSTSPQSAVPARTFTNLQPVPFPLSSSSVLFSHTIDAAKQSAKDNLSSMVPIANDHLATVYERLLASGVSALPTPSTLFDSTGVQASSVSLLPGPSTMPGNLTTLDEQSSDQDYGDDEEYCALPARNAGNLRPSARTAYAKRINTDGVVNCDESKFSPCRLKIMEQEQGQDLFPLHGICFQLPSNPAHAQENVSPHDNMTSPPQRVKNTSSNAPRSKGRKASSSSSGNQTSGLLKVQEQHIKPVSDAGIPVVCRSLLLTFCSIPLSPSTYLTSHQPAKVGQK